MKEGNGWLCWSCRWFNKECHWQLIISEIFIIHIEKELSVWSSNINSSIITENVFVLRKSPAMCAYKGLIILETLKIIHPAWKIISKTSIQYLLYNLSFRYSCQKINTCPCKDDEDAQDVKMIMQPCTKRFKRKRVLQWFLKDAFRIKIFLDNLSWMNYYSLKTC